MIDQHFRDRWRAIVGVDDMVGLIHQELEKLGVLDNTYQLRQTFLLILSPCQSRDIFGGQVHVLQLRSCAFCPSRLPGPLLLALQI